MKPYLNTNRRDAIKLSALLVGAGLCPKGGSASVTEVTAVSHGRQPLAQEFTVAITIPEPDLYIHDPGMEVLPSRNLFVVAPVRRRRELEKPEEGDWPQATALLLARSKNQGKDWESLPTIPKYRDATPFVHKGSLYLLIPDYAEEQILLMRSDDEGESWSAPVAVLRERLWNCQTSMAMRDGWLYWALTTYPGGNVLKAISVNAEGDLMDPKNWSVSEGCDLPAIPDLMKDALTREKPKSWHRPWAADTWLEPNVVNVNGRLRVLSRVVTDDFATAGLGAVCEIQTEDGSMAMKFSQFHPMPGGQCKFMIVRDDVARMFWMLANIPTDSHDLFDRGPELVKSGFVAGPGNERRILTLHYSLDAMNWFPAGIVAIWPNPLQAFMYPSAAIDRDDLVFVSRTSQNAPNQHDAEMVTFHRIQNFRSLAVNLHCK